MGQLDAMRGVLLASPTPASTAVGVPRGLVSQLALAQSEKIDRIVEWVGLVEDKVYFILFPPPEQEEKEKQALEFRRRTDDVRNQFQAAAQREIVLRMELINRDTRGNSGK